MRYFAYGSNMLTARLRARCPAARPVGLAMLPGHATRFAKRGRDGSGKATILPDPHTQTVGVLYDFAPDDVAVLDRIEGVGAGYERLDNIAVHLEDKEPAFTYIATDPVQDLKPFDWYLALIIAGCREHSLPRHVQDWYQAHSFEVDDAEPSTRNASSIFGDSVTDSGLNALVESALKAIF